MSIEKEYREPVKLSAVIIGRNEEQFIARSIRSVLAAGPELPGVEVIFVDSDSTDRSVEIAAQFPIRILQLRPTWRLGVAAGRYTGYRHANGEYTLFLDGDAEVETDWLVRAIEFMDRDPQYGGIAGVLDEKYIDINGVDHGGVTNVRQQDESKAFIDVKTLGGIALFRSAAIDQAGTVNPHLPTAEDHELCLRIRNCGFKLATIPGRMAIKYTEKRDTMHEIMRRSRTGMYDYGTVVRYAALYGCGMQFCLDAIPHIMSSVATLLILLLAVPLAIHFNLVWLLAASAVLLCLAIVIKKKSIRRAWLSVATRSVSTCCSIVSYLRTKTEPIEAYPTDVIEVRQQQAVGTGIREASPCES